MGMEENEKEPLGFEIERDFCHEMAMAILWELNLRWL
jgi:hypothetical protein